MGRLLNGKQYLEMIRTQNELEESIAQDKKEEKEIKNEVKTDEITYYDEEE